MKILILSTWFPYPQNQGSKIRAYHLIRALARDHKLTLITFEDQPIQKEWIEHIGQFFENIKILPEKPFHYSKINTLLGFFSTKPSAVYAGYNRKMENLVIQTAREWKPDIIFAFTFVTAPYALKVKEVKRIVDIDNLLAIMLKEDINFSRNFLQKFRKYLAFIKFRNYENKVYQSFDQCLVVSKLDVLRLQQYTEIQTNQILNVPNGVDLEINTPLEIEKEKDLLIYNGALTYQPNFDAVKFFMTEIFPIILIKKPETKLIVTGKTDGVSLDLIPMRDHMIFTGYLDDIKPIVAKSQICVVPLRQGAGTRLKILEAMALGTAVISTTKGAEGLDFTNNEHIILADSPTEFAHAVIHLLNEPLSRKNLEQNAYSLIKKVYDWKIIENKFSDQLTFFELDSNK